jgi:hypothetical protein
MVRPGRGSRVSAAVGAAALLLLSAGGCGQNDENDRGSAPRGDTVEDARALQGFTAYWLGGRFAGYPARVQVRMDRSQSSRGTLIDYARCTPECRGAGGVHTTDDPRARRLGNAVQLVKRRGVPAAISPRGTYGVLLTGRYTIMIGAKDRATLEKAFDQVRPVDGDVERRLPAPTGHVPESYGRR